MQESIFASHPADATFDRPLKREEAVVVEEKVVITIYRRDKCRPLMDRERQNIVPCLIGEEEGIETHRPHAVAHTQYSVDKTFAVIDKADKCGAARLVDILSHSERTDRHVTSAGDDLLPKTPLNELIYQRARQWMVGEINDLREAIDATLAGDHSR